MIGGLVWLLLSYQTILIVMGNPLLKVPKVYNALITTDQNLAPSRAIPVIQPVIHRTAIGYSPPFYYQPGAPGYGAGYVPSYEPNYEPGIYNAGGPDQSESPNPDVNDNPDVESVDVEQESREDGKKEKEYDDRCKEVGRKSKDQVPLSFYPNFRSMHYDPYLYGFNAYPAFPTPGNYYLNYQPQGFPSPGPQGMPPPPPGYQPGYQPAYQPGSERPQIPQSNHEKKEDNKAEEKTEKIPDVPPPPVPVRRAANGNH